MLLLQSASSPISPDTPDLPARPAEEMISTARIAVCICTCRRPVLLGRALEAVAQIDLVGLDPARMVLIVVDNCPDGRAETVCERMRARLPLRLTFAAEARRGISFARNRAAEAARAEQADFVAFIDDDDLPRPDWLQRLMRRQHETGADLVFGFWRLPSELSLPCWLRGSRYFKPPRPHDRNRFGLPAWAGTFNVLLSRRVLELPGAADGPFRVEFDHCGGEDSDLFIRAKEAGLRHACAYDSLVVRAWDEQRLTLREVLRRGFLRGGSRVHIARAHLCEDQLRGLAWSSWRKLLKATVRLPLAGWRRERWVASLLPVVHAMGEIYAWAGQRYPYYLRHHA